MKDEKEEKAEKEKLDNEKKAKKDNEKKAKKGEVIAESDEEKSSAIVADQPPVTLGGTISIGGHNLDTVALKWWRSQIGLVQQEPFIFNNTIYKNVELGLIGSQWEHEDEAAKKILVEEACKEAFADEFISRLPLVSTFDTVWLKR